MRNAVSGVRCSVCSVQCSVFNVQCTVFSVSVDGVTRCCGLSGTATNVHFMSQREYESSILVCTVATVLPYTLNT